MASASTVKPKKATTASKFKEQLHSLVSTLSSAGPHYVRCIKSNSVKKAFEFDDTMILSQLRYSGMLETIKIRKAGYPKRFNFASFINKFRYLMPDRAVGESDVDVCRKIISMVSSSDELCQIGATKVFLKDSVYAALEHECALVLTQTVLKIQSWARMIRKFRIFKNVRNKTILIQSGAQ